MSFFNKITLKSKLFILSIFILGSLVSVATIGYNYITQMKKNLDSLYFGSVVPISTLNSIIHIYNHDIKDKLYKDELGFDISKSLVKVNTLWSVYAKSYKEEKELPYIEYTTELIIQNENNLLKIMQSCFQGCSTEKIKSMNLLTDIELLEDAIDNLMRYEEKVAKFQRHNLLISYDDTIFRLGIILFIIIITVMGFILLIFKSINETQIRLRQATKELKISNKKLENASYTDALTTLFNRRYFNLIYERELRRAKRSRASLCFMMLDIDYFKQYNDTYGHLEGDNALKSVAKTLKSLLKRPSDYVFRLGGEEFGILMTECDMKGSCLLAQQINEAVQDMQIPHAKSKVSQYLSISIGLVVAKATMDLDNEKLLSEADKNLYEAKAEGRNKFVCSEV
jgi:diguanylate cyclase (GGDEF)-like protein